MGNTADTEEETVGTYQTLEETNVVHVVSLQPRTIVWTHNTSKAVVTAGQ